MANNCAKLKWLVEGLTEVRELGVGELLAGDGLEPVGREERERDDAEGDPGEVDGALERLVCEIPLVHGHLGDLFSVSGKIIWPCCRGQVVDGVEADDQAEDDVVGLLCIVNKVSGGGWNGAQVAVAAA